MTSGEGISKKKARSAASLEAAAPVPKPEVSDPDLTPAELKEKLRAVIVNMDQLAERAARGAGERSLTASAEAMKGVSGFFKRIWTHTIAREYYRQKHVAEARESIYESRNIHAAELEHPADQEAHEATATALVERFAQDFEETLHEGETRHVITREGGKDTDVKGELMALMKDYAEGKIGDDDFVEAKKQVLHTVSRLNGTKGDSMYADNLLEIARQVKLAVSHGKAIEELDLNLDVVVGEARDSIQTETEHNLVDRAIEFAKKTPLGVLVNESTLAAGISIAIGTATALSKRVATSRLAAVGTFGATATLSGGLIGYAENKRTKEDRAQHARERAQGREMLDEKSPRREEMEKYIHEMRGARELSASLRSALYTETNEGKREIKQLNEEEFEYALAKLSHIEARIRLMDREHIDLLSYSNPTQVEQERFDLDMARAQAKVDLRQAPITKGRDVDALLEEMIAERMRRLTKGEGGIEERDRLFNKMKTKRVAWAATKGVLTGLAFGTVAQEAAAFANDERTGLAERLMKGAGTDKGPVVHTTWLEGLRRMAFGEVGRAGMPPVTEQITTTVTAGEYLERHELGTKIARDGWYDNDTPKPVFDKNELKLWWGGEKNSGLDKNGNYTFTVRHMVPGGSYHGNLSANAQELMKEGKLKMLLSLSQGTQAHPVEVPINPDGTVTIDPNSETGKLFFAEKGGKAEFRGRFAEVAQLTGTKEGTNHVRILATHVGKGVDELTDTVTREIPGVPPTEFVIDPPPVIPIYARRPLEPVNGRKPPNPFMPLAGLYGSMQAPFPPDRLRAFQQELSPRLRTNPDAQLEPRTEEEEYLARQSPEYRAKIETLATQTEAMNAECKVAICIPVAGHQEANNIEKTLSAYLNQTAGKDAFEVVLFVNQPDISPRGEKIKSDGTLDKIVAFKNEHPELNIRVMQTVIPLKEVRIGNIRKMLSDATLTRSLKREGNDRDLIMVSNDADLKGVAPEYVQNFIEQFEKNPKTDSFMGQLDWDPESYIRNPLVHVGTRLFQYISAQHRKAKRGIESSGANFAYRASTYAAVGGYNSNTEMGEDNDFGRRILTARMGSRERTPIAYGGTRVSRLYTSSRRAEKAIRDGLSPIEQWEKGFSAFDDEVRKVKWEETGEAPDYNNPEVVKKLVNELENIVNRTLMVSGRWWSRGPYATYQRRALGWLGIKYKLVGPTRIQITDASALIEGLKEYKEEGIKIMERKMGRQVNANPGATETVPQPLAQAKIEPVIDHMPAAKMPDAPPQTENQTEKKSKIEKLTLPTGEASQERFKKRLTEYKEALKEKGEISPSELADQLYQKVVFERLLEKTTLDVPAFEQELRGKFGNIFNARAFNHAATVIAEYIKNETEKETPAKKAPPAAPRKHRPAAAKKAEAQKARAAKKVRVAGKPHVRLRVKEQRIEPRA